MGRGLRSADLAGRSLGPAKVAETRELITAGAQEIDMVLHIGRLRSGETTHVQNDITAVVAAAQARTVKVILETPVSTTTRRSSAVSRPKPPAHISSKRAPALQAAAPAVEDITLMRTTVSDHVQVKAAGGARGLDTLVSLSAAGATGFGATATAAILDDLKARHLGHRPEPGQDVGGELLANPPP